MPVHHQLCIAKGVALHEIQLFISCRYMWPLGPGEWTEDSSGRALGSRLVHKLVQALVYHLVGRQWRRKLEAAYPEEVAQVLQWFGDQACEQRPFSIHNMCATGQTHG